MDVVVWFAMVCGLVVLATLATTRARATPDAVIGRAPFVAVALGHAVVVTGAIWVWGGTDASLGHDAQLQRGPRVMLELRAVSLAVDHPISIGHAAASDVHLPGAGTAKLAEVTRDARGIVVTVACPPGTFVVPPHATLAVTDCTTPAFTVRAEGARIELAPAGRAARTTLRAGDVVRIGREDEPVPGLATWELPAAGAEILAVPTDPTDCMAWSPQARPRDGACELALGAFDVVAVPIVADPDAVVDRNTRAALAIGVPLVLACLLLAIAPRSRRRAPVLAHLLRIAVVAGGFTALVCWRLVWAYRIDVLRELAPLGARVADNQLEAALIGATLAGIAARRTSYALLAWATWLAIAWLALGLGPAHLTTARAAMIGLSLVAVFAPRASELRVPKLTPELVLVVLAGAAIAARACAPHGVLTKLVLAYALVLAGHAGLRAAFGSETTIRRRAQIALALVGAAVAVAAYDTGVAVAIGAIGLALAMLVAYHDAIYDASRANRIGILEREHARLIAVHGAVTVAIGGAAIAGAYLASDRAWIEHGADVASHAPLVAVGLFGFGAAFARAHRRAWLPLALAAIAALAVWAARGEVLERATAGHGVISDRVASVTEPGYALLHDGHRFAATASAWREAALPDATPLDRWHGEGLFGARIVDPGVVHSVENDYLPVLVARETGMAGIAQTTLLLLLLVAAAGAFASVAHRHASRAQRSRWLIAVVLGVLCMYQPLASLGVLPLTGISWPGLGIDSPSDLWLFVIAIAWCALGAEDHDIDDERVRTTARVVRARRIALAALATTACAGGIVVARSASAALARVPADDARIAAALDYGPTVACAWREHAGALATLVPATIGGAPTDAGTTRFDRELRAAYAIDRAAVLGALDACHGTAGHWRLSRIGTTCTAVFHAGGPELRLAIVRPAGSTPHATCTVAGDDEPAIALRGRGGARRGPRIRVVAEALGATALDAGELIVGSRIVRLRAGAGALELATVAPGLVRAGTVAFGGGTTVEVAPHQIMLHGDADLFVIDGSAWRRVWHAPDVALDHMALVVVGSPDHRIVVQVRPASEPLLADDVDRGRRTYPYGSALPELGWVNPFELEHSLGLDGWIHAAVAHPAKQALACGTLTPPPIARDHVCAASRLDGVLECKVALQPELTIALDALADQLATAAGDKAPTRIAYVVSRGDTGELLAQNSRVPGRAPLAYAPPDRDAEAVLVKLREAHCESDRERVEWNLPIAVGSTFKAIVARAAEQAFPDQLHALSLTAAGHGAGCKAHRGTSVAPLLGHCPPSSLAGDLTTADLHDFLAHSPNWFQAALGLVGLALPDGRLSTKAGPLSLADVASSDLASWPTSAPLAIDDALGPIVQGHRLVVAGLRRTPLWTRVEALLGRPLCTLGDRASCVRAADRADVCAARGLPIDAPSRDLRYLVALGPDRLELFDGDAPGQTRVPVREYFQLLRGAGAHPIGSLAQLADAFARVVYGNVAASWFPAPATGTAPTWSCADSADRTNHVLGAGGGLCAVVREGTARTGLAAALADHRLVIYGAKTGTTDSLAEVARQPDACAAWNASHPAPLHLACGKRPADDSLFVIAFGVVTPGGTIPLTLALQLQRGGLGSAAHVTPQFLDAIARYLRAE
ncbi:MAG: hypothetical protein ABI591_04095 [Kofleriaceae bacterium]